MATITLERNDRTGEITFAGSLTMSDILRTELDPFDRMLIADCSREGATGSDMLLALELIFRRAEEAKEGR